MDYNFLCGSSNIDDEQRLIAEPISFRNRGVSRKIYNDAFPKEDRMPFWLMPTMAKGRATEMHVYRDGDAYCGMDYVASLDGTTFVMFLAVDGRMRSRGYGGMILDRIKSDHPDDLIIVSFEPPVERGGRVRGEAQAQEVLSPQRLQGDRLCRRPGRQVSGDHGLQRGVRPPFIPGVLQEVQQRYDASGDTEAPNRRSIVPDSLSIRIFASSATNSMMQDPRSVVETVVI